MQKPPAQKKFWQQLETAPAGSPLDAAELQRALQFNAQGLLPVVAQCARTQRVLMLAWMNAEALQQTLSSGRMTYYSRSRQCLWQKGETSGNIQEWVSLAADCDGDALLASVHQTNAACHTGRRSCFYAQLAPTAQLRTEEDDPPAR